MKSEIIWTELAWCIIYFFKKQLIQQTHHAYQPFFTLTHFEKLTFSLCKINSPPRFFICLPNNQTCILGFQPVSVGQNALRKLWMWSPGPCKYFCPLPAQSTLGVQTANSTANQDARVGRNRRKLFDPARTSNPLEVSEDGHGLSVPASTSHFTGQPLRLPAVTPTSPF